MAVLSLPFWSSSLSLEGPACRYNAGGGTTMTTSLRRGGGRGRPVARSIHALLVAGALAFLAVLAAWPRAAPAAAAAAAAAWEPPEAALIERVRRLPRGGPLIGRRHELARQRYAR